MELYTTILRDGLARDVTIEFAAECVSPGYPATHKQPGDGPEYDITFQRAELDCPEPDDHGLTDAEMEAMRAWFVANDDKAWTAANDNEAAGR